MSKPMPDGLLIAIASGDPVSLNDILSTGVDINAFGETISRTALKAAAFAGNRSLITALVENGAILDLGNDQGSTPLHEAAVMNQTEAVELLLELGANIDSETKHGYTPLMCAAAWGNGDIVRMLLARGANIHHVSAFGDTALAVAELKEQDETAAILRNALSVNHQTRP